jgi:DNA polymerase III epsilon subunit-like protein
VLDTETTGLARADQVIEVGYITRYADGSESSQSVLWQTRRPIHPNAQKVHGITRPMLDADGIPAVDGLAALQHVFDRLIAHDAYLVIHNSKFDIRLLNQTAREHGVRLTWPSVQCSMSMARSQKLPVSNYALFHHFNGVEDGVAHRALVDCRMTLHSYTCLMACEQ